jgi:hypothetical protein
MMKRPLDLARAIGVPQLVRDERKTETLSERLHLGCHDGVAAGPAGDHDAGIVYDAATSSAAEKRNRFGEEDLAPEAIP